MNMTPEFQTPDDFSLVQGGPLFQLFIRSHLATTGLELLHRRILFFALLTWLPLLLLSAASGHLLESSVNVPFLYDLETHVRFLVALPLLLVAELLVHQRIRLVVRQFIERGIISAQTRPRFDACIVSALRLRNSVWLETGLIAFILGYHFIWAKLATLDTTIWYANGIASEQQLNFAGYWLVYISVPIFQFLMFRWLLRIIIWTRFLWQVAHLDLYLVATHPDKAGGLGFLAGSAAAFMPLTLSLGSLLSAMIAQRIFYGGAKLLDFKPEIAASVAVMLLIILGPLCVFGGHLARTKREGLLRYGKLATRYVTEFEQKWLEGGAPADEAFVGTGDIQSLADLHNSFEIIPAMRLCPFGKGVVLQIAATVLLPVLPLTLTLISLEELAQKIIGILL
ncbi:MAG: hypothetical protein Q8Q54_15360 [Methylococcales bacterium]|nr:hypothetical protein [Methylococcales bacterium]